MPRALPVFPTFFALYVSIVVVFLLAGLGPPLAGALPGVAETFEAWGEGEGPLSELWRGMAEAGHFSTGLGRLVFDYALSVLNLGLGVFIVWQRPRDKTARLLGVALVGTGLVFNIASHSFLVTAWFFVNGLHVTVHGVSGATYAHALLVFPNGIRNPRWSVWLLALGWTVTLGTIAAYIAVTFFGGTYENLGYGPGTVSEIYRQIVSADALLSMVFFGLLIPIVGLTFQVYRYSAFLTPAERQQTKLVVWAIAVSFGAALLFFLLAVLQNASRWADFDQAYHELEELVFLNFPFVFAIVSMALVVSILRYRLWDIDVIINRTLVYGSLTLALGVAYIAAVLLLQTAFRAVTDQSGSVAIVVSTLAIAALFQPMRRRIQALINQRFYRRNYDDARALAAFSATARDDVDLKRLSEALEGVVEETMEPAHVSLWLREGSAKVDTGEG